MGDLVNKIKLDEKNIHKPEELRKTHSKGRPSRLFKPRVTKSGIIGDGHEKPNENVVEIDSKPKTDEDVEYLSITKKVKFMQLLLWILLPTTFITISILITDPIRKHFDPRAKEWFMWSNFAISEEWFKEQSLYLYERLAYYYQETFG